jgi:hypothetical protein
MRNGFWPKSLEKLVKEGLPHPGSVVPICHELAKWLYWIELHHFDQTERVKTVFRLIWGWLKHKHNDTISQGIDDPETKNRVKRCVKSAVRLQSKDREVSLELFARLRQKRQQGRYKHLILLQPLLLAATGADSSVSPLSPPPTCISVSSLETPLPQELLKLIRQKAGRSRADKYATYFINLLYKNGGGANLARDVLKQWAGNNPTREKKYRDILVAANVITAGSYYRKGTANTPGQAKHYSLTEQAKEILDAARHIQDAVG